MHTSNVTQSEPAFLLSGYISKFKKIGFLILDSNFDNNFFPAFETLIDLNYPNINFYFADSSADCLKKIFRQYKCNLLDNYAELEKLEYLIVVNDMFRAKINLIERILYNIKKFEECDIFIFKQKLIDNNKLIINTNFENFLVTNKLLVQNKSVEMLSTKTNVLIKEKNYCLCNNLFTYSKDYPAVIKKIL